MEIQTEDVDERTLGATPKVEKNMHERWVEQDLRGK